MLEHADDGPIPRAFLAAVQLPDVTEADALASLAELRRLAKTLGMEVIGQDLQKRAHFDAAAYLGPGKVEEIAALLEADRADHPGRDQVVVVDHEISPSQARQLGKAVKAEVLDRTGIILEIFHRHARSREAKAQVEIVRLAYLAPRMRELKKGQASRQGGAGKAKGAGETHLELDRRKVRDRIAELREELSRIETERVTRRSRRQEMRRVALVGYTNAGKSTLMRALTGSDVYVADKLFATLDTTVRSLHPPADPRVLVSDTVGFIRNLPHDLVASFKSTLDETLEASLLLHVVDASDPDFEAQMRTTHEVLKEIGAGDVPARLVLNKCDLVEDRSRLLTLGDAYPEAWLVSAKSPGDVGRVRDGILAFFDGELDEAWIDLRHDQGGVRARLYETCEVLEERYDERGGRYRVRAHRATLDRIKLAAGS